MIYNQCGCLHGCTILSNGKIGMSHQPHHKQCKRVITASIDYNRKGVAKYKKSNKLQTKMWIN